MFHPESLVILSLFTRGAHLFQWLKLSPLYLIRIATLPCPLRKLSQCFSKDGLPSIPSNPTSWQPFLFSSPTFFLCVLHHHLSHHPGLILVVIHDSFFKYMRERLTKYRVLLIFFPLFTLLQCYFISPHLTYELLQLTSGSLSNSRHFAL